MTKKREVTYKDIMDNFQNIFFYVSYTHNVYTTPSISIIFNEKGKLLGFGSDNARTYYTIDSHIRDEVNKMIDDVLMFPDSYNSFIDGFTFGGYIDNPLYSDEEIGVSINIIKNNVQYSFDEVLDYLEREGVVTDE